MAEISANSRLTKGEEVFDKVDFRLRKNVGNQCVIVLAGDDEPIYGVLDGFHLSDSLILSVCSKKQIMLVNFRYVKYMWFKTA